MFGFLRRKKSAVNTEPPKADAAPSAESVHTTESISGPATGSTPDRASDLEALSGLKAVPAPQAMPTPTPPSSPLVSSAPADSPGAVKASTDAESQPAVDPVDSEVNVEVEPEASPSGAAPMIEPSAPSRQGWMARLRQGMSRTRSNLSGLFSGGKIDESLSEELETALLVSDAGFETTSWLLEELRKRVRQQRLSDSEQVREALRGLLIELLLPLEQPMDIDRATPLVLMIAGVNGAGKTTSIGKLAHHLQREGKSILLAAGDTFRAAAREQLAEWGTRNNVQVIAQQGGDPAAVAFDAVTSGRAKNLGVVMVDTAGRLPTQTHLMDELKKIHRVIGKAMPEAPHQSLLVLDGNTGQNMLAQVKAFDEAVTLTGLIVTKLDGTAKGGALAALAHTRRDRPLPVYFIGVGEGIDDLQAFSAQEFASALLD